MVRLGLLLAISSIPALVGAEELRPGLVEPKPGQTIAEAIAEQRARQQEQARHQEAVDQKAVDQVGEEARESVVPSDIIRAARQDQEALARELPADVELKPYDSPHFSATRIRGTLPEFKDVVVYDRRDIEALLPSLSRYLGFVGEEGFAHVHTADLGDRIQYLFFETIGGVLLQDVGAAATFDVDKQTGTVSAMQVSAYLDLDLPREPEITAEEGIALASKHGDAHRAGYDLHSSITRPEYRRVDDRLVLGWGLYLHRLETTDGIEWDYFWVSGDTIISGWNRASVATTRVCDHAVQTGGAHCDGQAIVVFPNGACGAGYSCAGRLKSMHDAALKAEAVWAAVLGAPCCNVGTNNSTGGGGLNVKINYPSQYGNDAEYVSIFYPAHIIPEQARAWIAVSDAVPNSQVAKVVYHEMGHAYHRKFSLSSYYYTNKCPPAPQTCPNAVTRENHAVQEAFADINAVIVKNYTVGANPPFAANPDWVVYGRDLSQQRNHSQIAGNISPQLNGLVGGHAFYELVQQIGLAEASKIVLNSVQHFNDYLSPQDVGLSFMDLRDAMIQAAAGNSGHISAIKNAFNDVGVGTPGNGVQPTNPTPPAGAPSAPVIVGTFHSCAYPYTVSLLSWNKPATATWYNVYHTNTSGQIVFNTRWNTESGYAHTTHNTTWRVRACNSTGCSAYSNSYYQAHTCH
ncbi:MAG: hypothetical protein RLO46_05140 [Pseudomonadales bacterium]